MSYLLYSFSLTLLSSRRSLGLPSDRFPCGTFSRTIFTNDPVFSPRMICPHHPPSFGNIFGNAWLLLQFQELLVFSYSPFACTLVCLYIVHKFSSVPFIQTLIERFRLLFSRSNFRTTYHSWLNKCLIYLGLQISRSWILITLSRQNNIYCQLVFSLLFPCLFHCAVLCDIL